MSEITFDLCTRTSVSSDIGLKVFKKFIESFGPWVRDRKDENLFFSGGRQIILTKFENSASENVMIVEILDFRHRQKLHIFVHSQLFDRANGVLMDNSRFSAFKSIPTDEMWSSISEELFPD